MLHVLHIEDQPDIQTILRLTLQATKQFKVDGAATGEAGLALADDVKPDVILLDYTLPDLTGDQILEKLRGNPATAQIPVIMLTALTDNMDVQRCRALGALDVIVKPFSPRTIAGQIRDLLAAHNAAGAA
ncbi:MAG: response regulator transcription factor [Rhodospirillaceae bacterium]